VHDSISGSTADIARILDKELSAAGFSIEVLTVSEARDLKRFDAMIIGSPMRLGNPRSTTREFISAFADQLSGKQVFFYYSLLYLIKVAGTPDFATHCYIDASLGARTVEKKSASGFDRHHSLDFYMKKINRNFRGIRLRSIAFFNGRLDISKLNLLERIFMNIIIRLTTKEKEGDFLNPAAVREWAGKIQSLIK
jgi:menaquinone-dependent protoporphyrinogen IX oxidase